MFASYILYAGNGSSIWIWHNFDRKHIHTQGPVFSNCHFNIIVWNDRLNEDVKTEPTHNDIESNLATE